MKKGAKVKNPCRICLQTVTTKNGLRCQGACKKWAHFKCLNYTPGKIQDIKAGLIKINCPCPDCDIEPKEVQTSKPYSCGKDQCPALKNFTCGSPRCPKNNPDSSTQTKYESLEDCPLLENTSAPKAKDSKQSKKKNIKAEAKSSEDLKKSKKKNSKDEAKLKEDPKQSKKKKSKNELKSQEDLKQSKKRNDFPEVPECSPQKCLATSPTTESEESNQLTERNLPPCMQQVPPQRDSGQDICPSALEPSHTSPLQQSSPMDLSLPVMKSPPRTSQCPATPCSSSLCKIPTPTKVEYFPSPPIKSCSPRHSKVPVACLPDEFPHKERSQKRKPSYDLEQNHNRPKCPGFGKCFQKEILKPVNKPPALPAMQGSRSMCCTSPNTTDLPKHTGCRQALSDSDMTATPSEARQMLLCAIEQMCCTVGQFSHQFKGLMNKMMEALEKCS